MYLTFWWASLCTLLYLEPMTFTPVGSSGSLRVQGEPVPAGCPAQQPQPAGSNWADQTTNSLRALPQISTSPSPQFLLPDLLTWPPQSLPSPPWPSRAFKLLPASRERRPKPSSCSLGPSPTLAAVISTSRWKANCVPALKDLQGSSFYNLCRNLVLTSHNSRREEAFFS